MGKWTGAEAYAPQGRRERRRAISAVTLVFGAAVLAGTAFGAGWAGPKIITPGSGFGSTSSHASTGSRQIFSYCHTGGGTNCVVDGDTFWIGGQKVRIAGIDAPETHPPRCPYEARLGNAATQKLHELLNSGAVTMTRIDRNRDRYGRLLRNVAVNGRDVGEALISAGVAREYGGGRRSWC